ncbi:MAG: pyridoxal phosphate-dependent aminotransferase [Clostridia bacterium]|nr:pyridoxal phosphate-dependent aminotransferase [Clostridia bacterium]
MISNEMLALGKKSSVIREIFEYGNRRRAEIGAENVFDFSLGNPSIPAPKAVKEAMTELLENTDPVALHGYTSAPGAPAVRAAIAESIEKRFGFPATAANIYMTCGAAASLTVSLKAILVPGDEVVVLAPFFPEYRVFVEAAGGKLVSVPSRQSDMGPDIAALDKAITPNTKAIIVNSPNNPTGAVIGKPDVIALTNLLSAKEQEYGTDIYLLADEPYRELVYGDVEVPYLPAYYHNTLVCYSYSKSLSLPGERIGYIFVSPKAKDSGDLFAAVCGAGRALGFVCAPSMMQYVIAKVLEEKSDIAAYKKNRDLLYNALTEYGYDAIEPQGAFYLFVRSPEADAAAFCEKAKKYELLLVPGDSFDGPGFVRISYCVAEDTIRRSLPAFKKLIEEYK